MQDEFLNNLPKGYFADTNFDKALPFTLYDDDDMEVARFTLGRFKKFLEAVSKND